MTNFIEVLLRQYCPTGSQLRAKKMQRDMQTLTDNEDFLTGKLSGEEKKRFIQYVDAWVAVDGESTFNSFITGFRLGAQFAFDTLGTMEC